MKPLEWKCGCKGEVRRREVPNEDGLPDIEIEQAVTERCERGEHLKIESEARARQVLERNKAALNQMRKPDAD